MFGNLRAALDAKNQGATLQTRKPPIYQSEVWGLIDDETIIVRFVGGGDEPHIFHQHGLARHPQFGFEKAICCKPDECFACAAASVPGEKRVKRASPYAAFTVYSARQMLLVPYRRDDGTEGFKKKPLRTNDRGEYIEKCSTTRKTRVLTEAQLAEYRDYDTEDEGLKSWCGSLHVKANNASKLLQLDMDLNNKCQCGKRVGQGLGARPAEVHVTDEGLVCTADCGNPRGGSLTACYVKITRRGTGTDTTYDFVPLPFSDPEPEHELSNLNLRELYAPDEEKLKSQLQARGIPTGPRDMDNSPDSNLFF